MTKQPTPETIAEAQGWVINANGKVELVAYCLEVVLIDNHRLIITFQ